MEMQDLRVLQSKYVGTVFDSLSIYFAELIAEHRQKCWILMEIET